MSEQVKKLARFFYALKKMKNNCIFLCQNFVISKNCTIFVIQSNTKLLTYKNYRYEKFIRKPINNLI